MKTPLGRWNVNNYGSNVLLLANIGNRDGGIVGAKAANLARMIRAGIPVPPGFCLAVHAYQQHINSLEVAGRFQEAFSRLSNCPADRKSVILSSLRDVIQSWPIAPTLIENVKEHYHLLGGVPLAVRSSATVEDLPGQSFAGQYDSYLGILNLEQCLEGIKNCWASLWTERAFDYREKNGVHHADAQMAVIVQALVPADISGIMFTADPITGRRDVIVIEGSFGLGEAVVSGKVAPDHIVLRKDGLLVEDRRIAHKSVEIVPDAAGGVRRQAVAADRADEPSIDDAAARRLGELGLSVEKLFASPQDIEWAILGGKLYCLQARPITALPQQNQKRPDDAQLWTNVNIVENLPGPLTPMTASIIIPPFLDLIDRCLDTLGIQPPGEPIVRLVAGRLYCNARLALAVFQLPFFFNRLDLREIFGGRGQGELGPLAEIDPQSLPKLHVNWLKMAANLPAGLAKIPSLSLRNAMRYVARLKTENAQLETDPASMQIEEIMAKLNQLKIEEFFKEGVDYSAFGIICALMLFALCRRWLNDADSCLGNRLLAATGGLEDAESGHALWKLALQAGDCPAVAQAILTENSFSEIQRNIAGTAGGDRFLDQWKQFMQAHGHHTRGELELIYPRWIEAPDTVLQLLRSYMSAFNQPRLGGPGPAYDPISRQKQLRAQREALAAECKRRLKNPLKRMIFDAVLRRAQQGLGLRETLKNRGIRRVAITRWLLLELGRRLAEQRIFTDPSEVFFLEIDELKAFIAGKTNFDPRQLIAERRADYEKNLTVTPPPLIIGQFDMDTYIPPPPDQITDLLHGLAVSPGVVTGPARVILHEHDGQLLPGEILVVPYTDPGWTPYFVNAAGIVIDQGGILSHGSVIAREYGIPCVVNVGPATRLIQTGQIVRVDGTRGQVRILR